MNKSSLLILLLFSCAKAFCQEASVVSGKIFNHVFSNIRLEIDENPVTGAQEKFEGILLGDGKFEIQAELYVPTQYTLWIDDQPAPPILLCPGENLTITIDAEGLEFVGKTGDFQDWNKVLYDEYINKASFSYAESQEINSKDTKAIVDFLFKTKDKNLIKLPKLIKNLNLTPCEFTVFKDRANYGIYTLVWSALIQKGLPITDQSFEFLNKLPLNDKEAAKRSLDYNRALSVYVFLKLRLANKWYDSKSFDAASDSFQILYYDQILKEISDKDVRNSMLSRNIISLLNEGNTSAESLFKRYLHDCSDSFYKKIAFKYYNDYLKVKSYSKADISIENLQGRLFEKLKQQKGKVLYIDFWASWCSPCLAGIQFTKKLQEKYKDQPFEVVYVSVRDNIGTAEATAKKFGLQGTVIYLDKQQSDLIEKELKFNGIPRYLLINKEGKIVNDNAPEPSSLTTEVEIEKLLTK